MHTRAPNFTRSRRRLVFFWALLSVGCATVVLWSLFYIPDRDVRYRQLSRARYLWERLSSWESSPSYRKISEVMKTNPSQHFREKVDQLESSLYQPGELVSLTFWVPSLQARQKQVEKQVAGIMSNFPNQFTSWRFSTDNRVSTLCRPEFVASVQIVFCCETNQISWGELRRLGGSRDDVVCRLPDQSIVDLDACHNWLRESIAGGWSVGVTLRSDRRGHSEIVVARKRAEVEGQAISPANGNVPVLR